MQMYFLFSAPLRMPRPHRHWAESRPRRLLESSVEKVGTGTEFSYSFHILETSMEIEFLTEKYK